MSDTTSQNIDNLEIEEVEAGKFSRRVKKVTHKSKPLKDFDALKRKAKDIQEQVTYLDEDVRMVESDKEHDLVILRSSDPPKDDEGLEYYQVEVKGNGETNVGRKKYTSSETTTEDTDFVVTDKILKRLSKDLDKISNSSNPDSASKKE